MLSRRKGMQEEWAAYLKVPVEYTNSLGMKFRLIPPGEFTMGSTVEETDLIVERHGLEHSTTDGVQSVRSESPRHKVVLTQPFYLSTREISRKEFASLDSESPSGGATDKSDADAEIPAGTSWDAAARFANHLGRQGGLDAIYEDRVDIVMPGQGTFGYRLPTEARNQMLVGQEPRHAVLDRRRHQRRSPK